MNRPTTPTGPWCATPEDRTVIAVMGGPVHRGVAVTPAQLRTFERLYGYDLKRSEEEAKLYAQQERAQAFTAYEALAAYEKRANLRGWEREHLRAPASLQDDVGALARSGAQLQLFRQVETDGLRLMALFAKFVPPGADPVKELAQILLGAGFDVPVDPTWFDQEG